LEDEVDIKELGAYDVPSAKTIMTIVDTSIAININHQVLAKQ
jgi:hypothetical protein